MKCFSFRYFKWMKMMKCHTKQHGRPFWINIAFFDFLHIFFLGYLPNPKAKHREGCEHVSQNGFPIRLTKKPKRCRQSGLNQKTRCFFPSLKQFSARVVLKMDGLKFLSYFSGVLAVGGGIHGGFPWSVLAFRHLPHVWEVPTAYSAVSSDDSVVSLLQALRLGSSRDVTLCDLGFVGLTVDIFWLNNMSTCRFLGFFPPRKDSAKGR